MLLSLSEDFGKDNSAGYGYIERVNRPAGGNLNYLVTAPTDRTAKTLLLIAQNQRNVSIPVKLKNGGRSVTRGADYPKAFRFEQIQTAAEIDHAGNREMSCCAGGSLLHSG